MPPKKQIQLQITLDSTEEWNQFISKEGLAVIDVYSAWCGPCKVIQGLFRRLKNELGDDFLKFGLAKADTIDYLEPYRNRSMPTFLLFAGGVLVAVVRGALGPLLEKTIKEQLNHEHKVLDGTEERKPIVDQVLTIAKVELKEKEEEIETTLGPTHKEFTVMVVKPDAVEAGKVGEIIEKVEKSGMEVLIRKEHHFTKDEAEEFYKQHADMDHFVDLVEFMSSGPCVTLVVTKGDTGEGVVEGIRDLIGPANVETARQEAPESIRAIYGQNAKMNAVHASDSREVAARELAFFLPHFQLPQVPEPPIERTLALIRPDALAKHGDAIIEKIQEAGFQLSYQKELTLTKEQAEEFYKEHRGKEFYDALTTQMSSGPMLALCLAREDAVAEWRKMLTSASGKKPENLRELFAVEGAEVNSLHGSDLQEKADEEIKYFFPMEHTLSVIKPSHFSERESIMTKIQESGFKVSMSNEVKLTREMTEQLYSSQKDKDYFNDLVNMMIIGPSMVMVLSKPEAVLGWRAVMGPTDPEEAKEVSPNSLRALYGRSPLENVVHGSSNKEHALQEIEQMFGPVKVLPTGSIELMEPEAKADTEVTKTEGEAPKTDGETPKTEGEAPKTEGDEGETPKTDGETPKTEGEVPKAEGEAPKTEGEAPKTEGETPKTEGEAPKTEGDEGEAPKTDGETPKTEGETPKTEGEVPKTEGETPKTEGEAPKTEGEAPKTEGDEGEAPKTDGETPKTEGEAPKTEREAPKTEGETPKTEGDEGEAPKTDGETPKTEGEAPKTEGDEGEAPKTDGETPKTEGEAPKTEGETPKTEGETPKTEGEAPKTDGETPKAEGEAPKTEGETPKTEGETPKTDGETPKAEGEAPKTEGETPKTEGETPKAEGEAPKTEGDEGETPKTDGETPKAEGEAPKTEGEASKTKTEGEAKDDTQGDAAEVGGETKEEPKEEEPKTEEEEPKVEGEEPKTEPKVEGEEPKTPK